MKFTTVHINSIILAVMLFVIQVMALWFVHQGGANGSTLHDLLTQNDFDALMVLFSPTAGVVWALKRFSSASTDRDD